MTDLAILARPALEGAAGKKDRSRTFLADQGRLLPTMQSGPGDAHPGTLPAEPSLVLQAVDTAIPGTERAFCVQGSYLLGVLAPVVHPGVKFCRAGVS